MAARVKAQTGVRHMGLLALVAATAVGLNVARAVDARPAAHTSAAATDGPGARGIAALANAGPCDEAAARVALAAARADADRAQREVDDAGAALADARRSVGEIVRRHYERGSLAPLAPVLGATTPGDALSALHSYRTLVRGEDRAVRRLDAAADSYGLRSAALDAARLRLARASADLDDAVVRDAAARSVPSGAPPR